MTRRSLNVSITCILILFTILSTGNMHKVFYLNLETWIWVCGIGFCTWHRSALPLSFTHFPLRTTNKAHALYSTYYLCVSVSVSACPHIRVCVFKDQVETLWPGHFTFLLPFFVSPKKQIMYVTRNTFQETQETKGNHKEYYSNLISFAGKNKRHSTDLVTVLSQQAYQHFDIKLG